MTTETKNRILKHILVERYTLGCGVAETQVKVFV